MDTKIPKKIHFIWFGDEMPWYTKYYISLVKQMYKGYKIKIWTEKDFDPNTITYTRDALEKKKYAFLSDYLRVKILYEEGGIYLDTDMVPIKRIEPYLKHKIVAGFEYSKMVTTGFVASEPKHPFMKRILDIYESFDVFEDEEYKFIVNNEIWTMELVETYDLKLNNKTQLLPGDIKIYPFTYFADVRVNKDSIWLHDHKLSWTTPRKAKVMNWMLNMLVRSENPIMETMLSAQQKTYFNKNKRRLKNIEKTTETKLKNESNKK